MFLLVVFGLPVAEIELREEKVSEETICILKNKRRSIKRCFTVF